MNTGRPPKGASFSFDIKALLVHLSTRLHPPDEPKMKLLPVLFALIA
jgi:hypothetical protein